MFLSFLALVCLIVVFVFVISFVFDVSQGDDGSSSRIHSLLRRPSGPFLQVRLRVRVRTRVRARIRVRSPLSCLVQSSALPCLVLFCPVLYWILDIGLGLGLGLWLGLGFGLGLELGLDLSCLVLSCILPCLVLFCPVLYWILVLACVLIVSLFCPWIDFQVDALVLEEQAAARRVLADHINKAKEAQKYP